MSELISDIGIPGRVINVQTLDDVIEASANSGKDLRISKWQHSLASLENDYKNTRSGKAFVVGPEP